MTDRFLKFIPFVLDHEGGSYEDNAGDPGGPTKWGIDHRSHPDVVIRSLTKDGAIAIYYDGSGSPKDHDNWVLNKCENLIQGLGESHFDACVNCGPVRANKFLIAACGNATKYNDERVAFYQSLAKARPIDKRFLKGWDQRVADLRKWIGTIPSVKLVIAPASAPIAPAPVVTPVVVVKALVSEISAPPTESKNWWTQITGWF
jgi:lysozyme family protein